MLIENFIDIENILNNSNSDSKQKLVSNISFVLIKHINQQNKSGLFNIAQQLVELLPNDKQSQLFQEVSDLLVNYLNLYATESLFSIIHDLSKNLNDENNTKVLNEINDVVEIFLKANTVIPETNMSIKDDLKESGESQIKENNIHEKPVTHLAPPPPPTGHVFKQPSSIFTTTLSGMIRSTPNDEDTIKPAKNIVPPAPPGPPIGIAPSVFTTTLSGMLKDSKNAKQVNIEPLPLEESLKYIIPKLTENGKTVLEESSTEESISKFLNIVDNKKSLSDIYDEAYKDKGLVNFINEIYSLFADKFISLKKSIDTPADKKMKLRTGEWLAHSGFIDKTLIERLLKIYKTALFIEENNKKFATKGASESKETGFGEHLVEVKVITEEQLSEALAIKAKFSELVDSLQ